MATPSQDGATADTDSPKTVSAELFSVAILTQPATGFVEQIHHRSPIFVPPTSVSSWINAQELEGTEISALLESWPVPEIRGHQVSPDVGKVGNNHPRLIEPLPIDDCLF